MIRRPLSRKDQRLDAWSIAARAGDAVTEMRSLELLAERRPTDPAGVIDPYRWLVDRIMAEFHDKRRYAKTARIPVRLKAAYAAHGDRAGFDAYLAELRIEHKRRPNFLVEPDRTKGLR